MVSPLPLPLTNDVQIVCAYCYKELTAQNAYLDRGLYLCSECFATMRVEEWRSNYHDGQMRLQMFDELRLNPGDILLLRVERNKDPREIEQLRQAFHRIFDKYGFYERNNSFMILPTDIKIQKLGSDKTKRRHSPTLRQARMIRLKGGENI